MSGEITYMKKLLSIIIPSYNMEKYLPKCLGSLIVGDAALLQQLDIIVVNDGSKDKTSEIAHEWGRRVRVGVKGEGRTLDEGRKTSAEDFGRRAAAERKIAEWLDGVTRESFVAALEKLVEAKRLAGEYKFRSEMEVGTAIAAAARFFDEFARKVVVLSDGRCVYFTPDSRAKKRNVDNSVSWAEYAFHAVSNGGERLAGKTYNERWYNAHKAANFKLIEETLESEKCVPRVTSAHPELDSILFVGESHSGSALNVVTRMDECGNIDANLTEVTFEASSKRQKKPPRLVPLAEAVQTVVHHQITAGSNPSNSSIIANFPAAGQPAERLENGKWRMENGEGGSNSQTFTCSNGTEATITDYGVIRVIDKPNRHYGSCINAALPHARGVYVKVLDADDTFETEALKGFLNLLEQCQETSVDLIVSDFTIVDETGAITETRRYNLPKNEEFGLSDVSKLGDDLIMHGVAYRTDRVRAIGYRQTEGCVFTDSEWMFAPMMTIRRARHFDRPLYRYLVGRAGQSVSSGATAIQLKMMKSLMASFQNLKDGLSDDQLAYAQMELARIYRLTIDGYFHGRPLKELTRDFLPADKEMQKLCPAARIIGGRHFALFSTTAHPFYYVSLWQRIPFVRSMVPILVRLYNSVRAKTKAR